MREAAAMLAPLLLLAGCGGGGGGEEAAHAATVTVTTPPSAAPSTAAPTTAAPTTQAPKAKPSATETSDDTSSGDSSHGGLVGTTITLPDAKIRVIKVKMSDVSRYNDSPDRAALVRVCARKAGVMIGWSFWLAVDKKEGQYHPASATYRDYPRPEFPFEDQELGKGQCSQGWVVFDTNKSTKLYGILYLGGEQAAWLIP